jgi:AcrR family transcriptional regulator
VQVKPFHHGNLRDELLGRARVTLRESGEDGLSLRQLAREAGVSHGAPRRHFPERQHLLDALAEQGFDELTATVAEQVARGPTGTPSRPSGPSPGATSTSPSTTRP